MAKSNVSDQIKTPTFVASWPALITPEENMNDPTKLEYSVTMLFPKATTDLSVVTNAIKALREKEFPGIDAKYLKLPIKDGDAPNTKGSIVEANKGHWVMRAKSMYAPVVVDRDGKTVIRDSAFIQSGNIMRGLVQFFTFSHKTGGNGVGATLLSVFKMGDGEPLAGGQGRVSPSVWADDVAAAPAASMGLDL